MQLPVTVTPSQLITSRRLIVDRRIIVTTAPEKGQVGHEAIYLERSSHQSNVDVFSYHVSGTSVTNLAMRRTFPACFSGKGCDAEAAGAFRGQER